jgi:hypothetical protein
MYYEETGDPAAPALVLLHGASGAIDAPSTGVDRAHAAFAERYPTIQGSWGLRRSMSWNGTVPPSRTYHDHE